MSRTINKLCECGGIEASVDKDSGPVYCGIGHCSSTKLNIESMSAEHAIKRAIILILDTNTSDQEHTTKNLTEVIDLLNSALKELLEE